MRGYPGSRGTGGILGVNPNPPPADQTTFETTEPLRDETLPAGGLQLTALPLPAEDELPLLVHPIQDITEMRGLISPYERPPKIELPIKNGRVKNCKFYVTDAPSAEKICLRTSNYTAALKTLEKEMTDWYGSHNITGNSLRMMDILHKGFYAAEIIIPSEGRFCWARVQVIENIPLNSEPRPVKVAAVDYGFEVEVLHHKLNSLRKQYREMIPQLGLKAELKLTPSNYNKEKFEEMIKKVLPQMEIELYDGSLLSNEDEIFPTVIGIYFVVHSGDTVQSFVENYRH